MTIKVKWFAILMLGILAHNGFTSDNQPVMVRPSLPANCIGVQDGRFRLSRDSNDTSIAIKSASASGKLSVLADSSSFLPDIGFLNMIGALAQQTLNAGGNIAFVSLISGSDRNQGIFVANENEIIPVAIGCGSGGGGVSHGPCGDPSPIGGTFTGFFQGTEFAPSINDSSDVLFLADVLIGKKIVRGLFLYRSNSRSIEKIAAVHDRSPYGGTLGEIGPGAMNNLGTVVFPATGGNRRDHQLILWKDGKLKPVLRRKDPAPNNSIFTELFGFWGFKDGTQIPVGSGSINDHGNIAFTAVIRKDGEEAEGIFRWHDGNVETYVTTADRTPEGRPYLILDDPILNNQEDIAFSAQLHRDGGWFTGHPGAWQTIFTSDMKFGSARMVGLAVSQNPMKPFNSKGDLVFWARLKDTDGKFYTQVFLKRAHEKRISISKLQEKGPLQQLSGTMPWPVLSDSGLASLSTMQTLMLWKPKP